MRKRLLPMLLAALLLLGAAGCSTTDAQINRHNAQLYVQGVLDETYTGVAAETYRTLVDHSEDDVRDAFQSNLEAEYAQRLTLRFELEDRFISRSLRSDFLSLLDTVYRRVGYTVKAATPLDNDRYCVEVSMTPVTFFANAYADGYDKLRADFEHTHTKPTQEMLDKLEPAQARRVQEQFESAWAKEVYDYLYARLDAVTTGSAVTKLVLVSQNGQGRYAISQTDLQGIDDLILQY